MSARFNGMSRRQLLKLAAAQAAVLIVAACGATPTATPVPPTATKPPVPTAAPAAAATATKPPAPTNTAVPPTAVPPSPTPAPKTPVNLDAFAFSTWGGYTGNEKDQFIAQFIKDKGRPPKDDEIPAFDNLAFYNKVSADYKAAASSNGNITWEALAYKDGRPKVDIRVAAGDPPDIVVWSMVDSMRFALLGSLVDLGRAIAPYKSDYNTAFLRQFRGTYYHLPMMGFVYGWRVNPVLFKANSVDNLLPTAKTNWMWSHDDFLKAGQAVTKGSGGTASYGFAGFGDWPTLYPMTFSFGGRAFADDGSSFVMADDPKAIQGIQFFVDLIKKYKVTPPENMTTAVGDIVDDLFLSARLGVSEESNYGTKQWFDQQVTLKKVDPQKVQFDAIVCPSDVKNNVKPQHYMGATGLNVFKRKEAGRNDAALDYLSFFQKPEYAAIYKQRTWPIRKAQETADDKDPYKVAYIQMMSSFGSEQLTTPWWVAVRSIMNPTWEAIVQGTKPIPDILKEAQAKINDYIKTDLKRVTG